MNSQCEYEYVGCANAWSAPNILVDGKWVPMHEDRTPESVKACRAAGHMLRDKNIGHCLTECYCDICKIYFDVDSSD